MSGSDTVDFASDYLMYRGFLDLTRVTNFDSLIPIPDPSDCYERSWPAGRDISRQSYSGIVFGAISVEGRLISQNAHQTNYGPKSNSWWRPYVLVQSSLC